MSAVEAGGFFAGRRQTPKCVMIRFNKLYNRLSCFFLSLCLVLALAPCAEAQGTVETVPDGNLRFEGKSWEEVVGEFLSSRDIDPDNVTLGYKNTVTGEEHYHNPDQYMDAGSLYKVPLNMWFAERIYTGELTWESIVAGTTCDRLQEWTIVHSDNNFAQYMWNHIGGYHRYRTEICPYMGVDPDTVEDKYYQNNFFTARQMIHCLNLLCTENERFPGIVDNMLLAEPENYFNYKPQPFPVAHKYGYNSEGWHLYLNDSAIVYTDEPIVIVMFTDSIGEPYEALADFCTLMCDYTQYHIEERLRQEALEAERKAAEEAERKAAEEAAAAARQQSETITEASDPSGRKGVGNIKALLIALVLTILVVIATISFIGRVARNSEDEKINGFWGVIAVLVSGAALLLSIVGMTFGTLVAKPSGDPLETVNGFFNSIQDGNYEKAYSYLADYQSLGLENQANGEIGASMQQAMRDSYSFKPEGNCVVDGLDATQSVQIRYLDLDSFSAQLEQLTNESLQQIVADLPRNEIYDENDKYLPSVTDAAYSMAVDSLLGHVEDYYKTTVVKLELSYHGGKWQLKTNPQLMDALIGGCY